MGIQTVSQALDYEGRGSPYGFKNRIINGFMAIDQRNAGASVIPTTTQYTLDRWAASLTQTGKYSVCQMNSANTAASNYESGSAPAGFTNSIKITSQSSYANNSTDYFGIYQPIEGNNIADLDWGISTAKTVTLSFWAKSSLGPATFGGSIKNSSSTRSYAFNYTLSGTGWEYKSLTIPGCTDGTWLRDNGLGMYVTWSLGTGSTYSGTASGTWQNANYAGTTDGTRLVATNLATLYITGVQFEVAKQATSFDYRPYGTELMLCQRYFETNQGPGWQVGTSTGSLTGEYWNNNGGGLNTYLSLPIKFAVYKRASPTVTLYSPNTGTINKVQTNWSTNLDATSVVSTSFLGGFSGGMGASPGGVPSVIAFNWTSSSEL